MSLTIRTRNSTITVTTPSGYPIGTAAQPNRANDTALDDAAFHLREALLHLDLTENLIAAAYVDQALSMLRGHRVSRASEA
ncbi:hypothetical protein [Novosphingobium olei]|uniref:Uncharacterized protein n=1 Tax=Novosphingobium olei TaxID=2728851 RepID=A0A7Y0G9Z6_9SPHN|nr:hypothetical protein [Novosphingobium olei]NML93548.1 hypothetical protein [Novosphingobium olei]